MKSLRWMAPILVAFWLVGCNTAADPTKVRKSGTASASIVDYGNGVYYFPLIDDGFGNALSAFLGSKSCKVEGMTGSGTSAYGIDQGYWVVCR